MSTVTGGRPGGLTAPPGGFGEETPVTHGRLRKSFLLLAVMLIPCHRLPYSGGRASQPCRKLSQSLEITAQQSSQIRADIKVVAIAF